LNTIRIAQLFLSQWGLSGMAIIPLFNTL
jgi:hypothetical protein